jgi:hypothetical protein
MKYIDRRFLFPVVAATAWAQQPSPAVAEAEAALRAKAEQFFQLQVDKKFRQAESLVAEDSKDDYYNGNKYDLKGFKIDKIEWHDENSRAVVTIKAKIMVMIPGLGPTPFDAPSNSLWKLENGQWVWYIDKVAAAQTPFGEFHQGQNPATTPSSSPNMTGKAPDLSTLRALVKVDRDSVELTADGSRQTVTVSNELPGGVDLELRSDRIPEVSAELEKKHLEAGEKTVISLRASTGSGHAGVVSLIVSPITAQLDIHVKVN